MRIGEILGLTWDCVEITDESIAWQDVSIYIEKELQRVSMQALTNIWQKDIVKVFPSAISSKKQV